jgi:hypothetical protein
LQLWISERKGKIPIEVLYLPRPASDYKGCYPMWFERHLPRLLETDNYIHFFAGKAKTGFRIDINPTEPSIIKGNVEDLFTIPDNSFDGGMADPPYTPEFARDLYNCDYPKWSKWTHELVRVVKPNGLIGIMNNYPVPRLAGCDWEKIVIILLRIKQYPKIVTIQRKRKTNDIEGSS